MILSSKTALEILLKGLFYYIWYLNILFHSVRRVCKKNPYTLAVISYLVVHFIHCL